MIVSTDAGLASYNNRAFNDRRGRAFVATQSIKSKHVIVKNRLHLTFIIGREDMTGLNLLDFPECIKGTYEIKVRAQIYQVEFGIYINA